MASDYMRNSLSKSMFQVPITTSDKAGPISTLNITYSVDYYNLNTKMIKYSVDILLEEE